MLAGLGARGLGQAGSGVGGAGSGQSGWAEESGLQSCHSHCPLGCGGDRSARATGGLL